MKYLRKMKNGFEEASMALLYKRLAVTPPGTQILPDLAWRKIALFSSKRKQGLSTSFFLLMTHTSCRKSSQFVRIRTCIRHSSGRGRGSWARRPGRGSPSCWGSSGRTPCHGCAPRLPGWSLRWRKKRKLTFYISFHHPQVLPWLSIQSNFRSLPFQFQ